jgi:hypothetical protein
MFRLFTAAVFSLMTVNALQAGEEPQQAKPDAPGEKRAGVAFRQVEGGGAEGQKASAAIEEARKKLEQLLQQLREKERVVQKVQSAGTSPNQEIIDLLKKVIQKLEAQGKLHDALKVEMRLQKPTYAIPTEVRWVTRDVKKASPEVEKAQAEVKAAEQRLREAQARLAQVQAVVVIPQPRLVVTTPPAAGSADLEKRLNRLVEELEALRRDIKKSSK